MKYYRRDGIDTKFPQDDPNAPLEIDSVDPIYGLPEKYVVRLKCPLCGTTRRSWYFQKVPDNALGYLQAPVDKSEEYVRGTKRTMFCLPCLFKMCERFEKEFGGDKCRALYRICSITDIYFDYDLAKKIINDDDRILLANTVKKYEEPMDPRVCYCDAYFRYVERDPELSRKTFWGNSKEAYESTIKYQLADGVVETFEEKDKKTRRAILSVYHYDPFENEDKNDRPRMMEDLLTMTDDSMADDLVRQKAAIEIVRAFNRIEKIGNALTALQATPQSAIDNAKQIKELIDQKKKETDMVTSFSKDHGFAEKYATAKSKGSGSLSAIVRDITEYGYDKGAINKFDIETSAAMKQVSDISAESIFKQVNFSGSDYADMVKMQAVELKRVRETMEAQAEELRLLKEKHLKQELLEEYRADLLNKGIKEEEVDGLVNEELMNPTSFRRS